MKKSKRFENLDLIDKPLGRIEPIKRFQKLDYDDEPNLKPESKSFSGSLVNIYRDFFINETDCLPPLVSFSEKQKEQMDDFFFFFLTKISYQGESGPVYQTYQSPANSEQEFFIEPWYCQMCGLTYEKEVQTIIGCPNCGSL